MIFSWIPRLLLAFFLSVELTRRYLGTTFEAPLRKAAAALALSLPDQVQLDMSLLAQHYTFQPSATAGGARRYAPGDALAFGVGLIGPAAQLFPYVFMAAQEIEQTGLGRRLVANNGRRGSLQIDSIAAVNPLTGAQQPLYQRGCPQVQAPGLLVARADVAPTGSSTGMVSAAGVSRALTVAVADGSPLAGARTGRLSIISTSGYMMPISLSGALSSTT
jgi:hypothetical protein